MPRYSRDIFMVLVVTQLLGCAVVSHDSGKSTDNSADAAILLELNEKLARSQIVDRDPTFFSEIAVAGFHVLAPGGMIEEKNRVIAGMSAWNAVDVQLTNTQVVFHGEVATVMGRMDIDGEMKPVGRWGPLKYMSTWIREEGEWRLLSRSLTPCLDILIKMGRC